MGPIWKDSKPVPLLISRDNFAIWEGGSTILIRIKRQMYKDVNDIYNLCRNEADALKQSGTREASLQRTRDFVYLSRVLKHALYCAYQEAKEADGPKDKVFNWPREEITMDLTLAIQNLRANRSFKIGALLTKEQYIREARQLISQVDADYVERSHEIEDEELRELGLKQSEEELEAMKANLQDVISSLRYALQSRDEPSVTEPPRKRKGKKRVP